MGSMHRYRGRVVRRKAVLATGTEFQRVRDTYVPRATAPPSECRWPPGSTGAREPAEEIAEEVR